jgi:hypothetical protein
MTAEEITQYLAELNDELCALDVKGEVCLYGGVVMFLVYKARPATKDVDAVFEPVKFIRRAAAVVGERHQLETGWLNFAVKMSLVEHQRHIFLDLPCLKVYVPETDYLLAMKVLAARADTSDADDILFLVNELNLSSVDEVSEIARSYYPRKEIKPEAVFLLEEIFERRT